MTAPAPTPLDVPFGIRRFTKRLGSVQYLAHFRALVFDYAPPKKLNREQQFSIEFNSSCSFAWHPGQSLVAHQFLLPEAFGSGSLVDLTGLDHRV